MAYIIFSLVITLHDMTWFEKAWHIISWHTRDHPIHKLSCCKWEISFQVWYINHDESSSTLPPLPSPLSINGLQSTNYHMGVNKNQRLDISTKLLLICCPFSHLILIMGSICLENPLCALPIFKNRHNLVICRSQLHLHFRFRFIFHNCLA